MRLKLLYRFLIKQCRGTLLTGGCLASILFSCKESEKDIVPEYTIIVSETGKKTEPVDELILPADGGKDTLYVFAPSEISVKINESVEWVKVIDWQYDQSKKATMVILEVEAMLEDLTRRIGELDVISEKKYSRRFFTLIQGYKPHFSDDFSWLHYGQGNPLRLDEGVLIDEWNPAQKEHGWLSDAGPNGDKAYVYGKDGYIQLGSDEGGGSLSTPILTGVQNDSLMELTFNAVGFVGSDGSPDQNDLTVVLHGGVFDDGSYEKVVKVNPIDPESALIETKMWENTAFRFVVKKPENDRYATTIQITFVGGDRVAFASNRVFLDNVRMFSKEPYQAEPNEDNK